MMKFAVCITTAIISNATLCFASRCTDYPEDLQEEQYIEINLMSPFLVPQNSQCGGYFSNGILEGYNFVIKTLECYGSLDAESIVLSELCDSIYNELEACNWQHPNNIPRWTYPIISQICKMCECPDLAEVVINSNLGGKILELWPLDWARSNYQANCQKINKIGNMLEQL